MSEREEFDLWFECDTSWDRSIKEACWEAWQARAQDQVDIPQPAVYVPKDDWDAFVECETGMMFCKARQRRYLGDTTLVPLFHPAKPESAGVPDERDAERVVRAFWRRIYPYRNDYGKELPDDCPVEFVANMATALMALNIPHPAQGREQWVKCSEQLPEPAKKTRRNPHGILVYFDNGRIERFEEVSEFLVGVMKNGPRQPLKFEARTPARMTHWMELHPPQPQSSGEDEREE